jgi:hypothetical protein
MVTLIPVTLHDLRENWYSRVCLTKWRMTGMNWSTSFMRDVRILACKRCDIIFQRRKTMGMLYISPFILLFFFMSVMPPPVNCVFYLPVTSPGGPAAGVLANTWRWTLRADAQPVAGCGHLQRVCRLCCATSGGGTAS